MTIHALYNIASARAFIRLAIKIFARTRRITFTMEDSRAKATRIVAFAAITGSTTASSRTKIEATKPVKSGDWGKGN